MAEDEARRVKLLRAVEVEDPEATPLTREDRKQAEAHARHRVMDAFDADPLDRSLVLLEPSQEKLFYRLRKP